MTENITITEKVEITFCKTDVFDDTVKNEDVTCYIYMPKSSYDKIIEAIKPIEQEANGPYFDIEDCAIFCTEKKEDEGKEEEKDE